ncbi:MAG: lactate utilization protein [Ruminococcus sp.]|nr:lactate utilization protein [Ruminococcus sp.]MBQ1903956.1 lactate utilization protein [Ruminococcus sp.]
MQTNEQIMEMLRKTADALEKNNMQAFVAQDCRQAVNLVKDLMAEGETISCGGSVSLEQSGVMELMKSGSYNFLDRSKCETREETEEIYRKSFCADTYLTSANAVTMNGELYNVDGNSNRVAAIAYGPKSVIFIVGCNKIVKDLDEAVLRVKQTAAPQNTVRLQLDTPCSKTGECFKCAGGKDTASGCRSEKRICCSYLVSGYQRHKNRYKVILVAQPLGY